MKTSIYAAIAILGLAGGAYAGTAAEQLCLAKTAAAQFTAPVSAPKLVTNTAAVTKEAEAVLRNPGAFTVEQMGDVIEKLDVMRGSLDRSSTERKQLDALRDAVDGAQLKKVREELGVKTEPFGALLVGENDSFGLRTGLAAVTESYAGKAIIPPGLACYNAAVNSAGLSGSSCMELCRGAESTGPVDCYRTAVNSTSLANGDSIIELCRGAESTGPADCFRKAANTTSLADGASIIKLCKNARNTDPADCFRNASQTTSMSVADMLRFCKENPHHG